MDAEPPELPADQIADELRRQWNLNVDAVHYAKVGHGSHHWIAHSKSAPTWFVTGDELHKNRLAELETSARVARDLTDSGLDFVIAPITDVRGNLVRVVNERWAVQVLPFVDGHSTDQGSWTDPFEQAEVAWMIGRLHAEAPPGYLPIWDPTPAYRTELESALHNIDESPPNGSAWQDRTLSLLQDRGEHIHALLQRYDKLVPEARADSESWVLTHGEPDSDNVIRVTGGGMVLIDWTSAAIAPRERDLFDVLQGPRDVLPNYQGAAGPYTAQPQFMEMIGLYWRLIHLGSDVTRLLDPHGDNDLHLAWARLLERIERSPGNYTFPI